MMGEGETPGAAVAPEQARPLARPFPEAGPSAGGLEARRFETGHLLAGLKGRTISSGVVTALAQGVQFGLNLGSIVVLARLLAPQDFGLVAMVSTVMSFLRIFNDAGLSTATVQRESITHAQVSNLFWANVGIGFLISLGMAALAPGIAWFYHDSRLIRISFVLGVTFLVSGLTVQHMALLKREMRFKVIALIQVGAVAASFLVGIGMAWMGCGYWSLVGMQLCVPVITLPWAWLATGWRPQLPKARSGTRPLLHFGASITISSFLWSLARGSDGLLIGRFYGSTALGFYTRAAALINRPVEQLMSPLESVFVPALSRLQSEPERYRRVFLQAYESVALASFPLSGLLFALARPVTLVVLGTKWENAAAIFAGFTLVALYIPIASIATWLLGSQARGRDLVSLSVISSLVAAASFLVGLPFGPVGVATAYSVSSLMIQLPVAYHIAGRRGPVATRDLWTRFFTHLPLWGIVCGATWLTRALVPGCPPIKQLLLCVPAGLLAGAAFIYVYAPARRVAASLLSMLGDFRTKKSSAPRA